MSTATRPPRTAATVQPKEIKLISHSPIFYWWPVWAVGYVMALVTYLDGGRLVVLPPGPDGHTALLAAADGQVPQGERPAAPAPSPTHMAHNPYLGTWFCITLLVVFVSTNVPLRGLWEWISVLAIALVVAVVCLYGWWQNILDWFYLLHIQINLAGYVFLSTWLFAIWAVTVFYFDTRTYVVISPGQVRTRLAIGQGEKVYDATNLALHLQPNILFRHRFLGLFGAGDLVVRTGGPHAEVFEWPNVLFVRSRLKRIEHLLQSREVMQETA
jgi:hypothetical protein